MNHGSLFSGIGGFDLAAEWMGWDNIFHCEWNDFGKKVLKYYWPKSISYHDITKTDFTIHRGTIDILTGGFPCQPYSTAGKRLGKEDERHLWPEMLRAIREIEPTWIVGENVRGLVSWSGGLVFEEVCADLEAQGYSVQPFLLPAASVNAPHRRDRVWFVANRKYNRQWDSVNTRNENQVFGQQKKERPDCSTEFIESAKATCLRRNVTDSKDSGCRRRKSEKCSVRKRQLLQGEQGWSEMGGEVEGCCREQSITNTTSERLEGDEWRSSEGKGLAINSKYATDSSSIRSIQVDRKGESRFINKKSKADDWQNFPTVAPICNGDDGLPNRLDSITFPKWRNESIKAGGNAIVPQVAYQIFKAIQNYENQTKLF